MWGKWMLRYRGVAFAQSISRHILKIRRFVLFWVRTFPLFLEGDRDLFNITVYCFSTTESDGDRLTGKKIQHQERQIFPLRQWHLEGPFK